MMPTLYALARPTFTDEFRAFLDSESLSWKQSQASAAERLVEFAGRICYMSFGKRQSPRANADYLQHLISQGHESVLEHVNWTFLLTGVTRAFTHQLVRHRVGFAFSQLSQQYHDESEATFVLPEVLEAYPEALAAWHEAIETSRQAYKSILETLGTREQEQALPRAKREAIRAVRSAARSVLPNATETKIVVTANARALRHFLTVRGALEGDVEMRLVSKLIYDLIVADAPTLVADFIVRQCIDGTPLIARGDFVEA